ncbi:protoheme IX farnesyltransferase [bacterium K02(2017)]|nr:protoheme IX farnesyltransferase [bacterium K02(2017)]
MKAYLQLTKPTISFLFAITGMAAMLLESHLNATDPVRFWVIVFAIFLTGGAANAFNQYFERDVDKKMARTAKKRPLPQGLLTPFQALAFSLSGSIISTFLLFYYGGILAAALGVGTILFYSFYYTLWLKPRTPYNIVIGGIAGAMGPLIGCAAVTGSISWAAFIMFLIIFMWTPPHFWALAICCKEDYKSVSYPMLPLVVGDQETRKQILYYSFVLIPLSACLHFFIAGSVIYLLGSVLLGSLFLFGAYKVYHTTVIKTHWQFFAYSIVYLLALFGFLIADVMYSAA